MGWAPEASNEAPNESVTVFFACARIRLLDALPKPSLDLKSPAVPVVSPPRPIAMVSVSQNVPGAATITPQNESRPVEPVRKRRRLSLSFGDDGEVLPRKGLFPVFVSCRLITLRTIEGIAIWAFHVHRT